MISFDFHLGERECSPEGEDVAQPMHIGHHMGRDLLHPQLNLFQGVFRLDKHLPHMPIPIRELSACIWT